MYLMGIGDSQEGTGATFDLLTEILTRRKTVLGYPSSP
jgi:hypothetical protein